MGNLDQSSSSEEVSVNSEDRSIRDSKVEFSEDEEELIARMYSLIGERWSLIAGRIPGRSAEEIEVYCTSRYMSGNESAEEGLVKQ